MEQKTQFVKVLKDGGLMTKRRTIWLVVSFFVAYFSVAGKAAAITLPELASRVENMVEPIEKHCSLKAPKKKKKSCSTGRRR